MVQTIGIVLTFTLTYLLVAARSMRLIPIGRPAGTLLGAVLMVAIGALTPEESYRAVDHNTIVLLFGMMLLTVYLDQAGFFEWSAAKMLAAARTPWALLAFVSLLSGGLAAFLVNDTVCLFLTPVIVVACRQAGLPLGPYLIAIATSANIGSAATLVGNPQNMIIGTMSRIPFVDFLLRAGPAAAAGLAINIGLLAIYYHRDLPPRFEPGSGSSGGHPGPRLRGIGLVGCATAGIVAGFFAGFHLGYTTLAGVLVIILARRRDPREVFARVDWALLIFFSGLFVVVAGLEKTHLVERTWRVAAPYMDLSLPSGAALFTGLVTLGSNLVSNVPMVLLAGPYLKGDGAGSAGWVLLAFTTTIAGNLTLVGSVANIIVAEKAKEHYALGFVEYFRFGVVSTVLVLLAGVPLIYLVSSLLPGVNNP